MKIIFIGQKGIPAVYGGIERHVEELAAELVKQGHEVFAYARKWYTPDTLKEHRGIKILYAPTIRTKHLDAIAHTFTATIHALFQKPDVIHYHGVGPSLLSWIPRLFAPKIKVIATFHCIDRYHQKWGLFARIMLALGEKAACVFPHQTIGVSKVIQKYCLNEFNKNTVHNPNGVTIEDNPGAKSLAKWNLTPGKYLLMVSRLVKHKGAHYLIDAWQSARRDYPELTRDYQLVIVGGSSFTDDYVKYLRQLAGHDQTVIFTDWQNGEALNALYANCTMLVHPSENEGLPITVLQAMGFGRPALVSDIAEHQEVINDSRFWFMNTSTYSLAERIVELIKNPALLAEAGQKNLKTVERFYQWSNIAKKTAEIYRAPTIDKTLKKLQTA
ncbi:MAG: glycosyltransferase family 4 protein [Patescibacteria group bacterium]|nr:glycosyltransferase family 4 protein [Patescibacteria group bacterium]